MDLSLNAVNSSELPSDTQGVLPEGFTSVEELAEAYKKLTTANEETDELTTGEKETEEVEQEEEQNPQESTDKLDIDKLVFEVDEDCNFSEEKLQELKKLNINKELATQLIQGRRAQMLLMRKDICEAIGGEENFQAMADWAQKTLSKAETDAYDKMVNASREAARLAVTGLYQRYREANPQISNKQTRELSEQMTQQTQPKQKPALMSGAAASNTNVYGAYTSTSQLVLDMSSSKYKTDPAFRDKVARKLANSDLFN